MPSLHRYWIRYRRSSGLSAPIGTALGVGVTAYDVEDALRLVNAALFPHGNAPERESMVEDVDISTLDAKHVQPNLGNIFKRGVWFPIGYE